MGRRHRSSSVTIGTTTTAISSTNDNNNKAAMPNNEDLTACTFLLRQFVHSTNQNQETGRTPFHRAVGAVSVARNGNDDNDDDNVSTTDSDSIRGGGDTVGESSSNDDKERERMDGLFIIDALATRMKEMDALSLGCSSSPSPLFKKKKNKMGQSRYNSNISNNSSGNNDNNNNGSSSSHFHQLMTTRDNESGYTPLHYSILQRDLMTMLLLLQHASTSSLGRDAVIDSMLEQIGGGGFNINRSNNTKNINNMSLSLHPLRLLDGNLLNNDDNNTHDEDSNQYDVINDLTCTTDKEGLTPLQLLGKSSCGGLEHCRRTLTWRALKEGWRMKKKEQFQQTRRGGQREQRQVGISTSVSAASSMEETLSLSGRYRRRMISFGDDRDYDSLQYDIDSGDTNNNDDGTNGDGRARGGSFSINLDDGHFSDGDDDDESGDTSNDLIPLDDVDFNVLADTNNGHEDADDGRGATVQQRQQQQQQSQRGGNLSHANTNDYGCEVLTFGRSDHCALGVPQLSSRIRSDYNGKGGKDDSNNFFTSPSFDKTYKPKRVETFALGDLRRGWSSSSSSTKNHEGDSSKRDRRNRIDSPAVACAASTHHTLVATRSGQLYSFGLGKGGRLGLGDESHRPLPTRILGPLSKRIVASIAAAENHSLCSTSDGAVFAWGSNGFGQLGIHSSRGNAQQNPPADSRLSPRLVEGKLKQSFVVGVACGERHSVALTRLGEVYCWGDNKKGQLGVINVSETQSNGPQRVEGLWSHPRRRAIAISAAAHSTLVLTMPPTISAGVERELASLPVNTIYGWGHGNHSPLRVVFPTTGNSFASQSGSSNAYSRMICINPTAIACAKYHNVAITKDGQVYTWGLHSDSLGVPQQASFSKQKSRSNSVGGPSNSSIISSPVLVTAVGNAVSVSASESHTAIVTSEGYLFTWGESSGHKGVRWQPSPRRVKRVHRAVAVAAGKEHTVMLIGATFPPLPNTNRVDGALSLQHSAAIELSRNVDLFNVIPLALVAYRFNCRPLINFCDEFMRHNLDGVLAVGMKNDFDAFLSSRAIVGTNDYEHDGMFHPFLHLVVNTKRWVYSGRALLKQYESTIALPAKKLKRNAVKGERKHSVSQHEEEDKPNGVGQRKMNDFVSTTSREDASKNNESMVTPTNLKTFPETEPKADVPPPVPTARGKYYCDLCAISCPDSDSYTFHIHGRKHRNREMHAEAAEEKSVAESMMAMKRMQLVEKSGEDYARIALERDTKQHDKSNIAWGAQHAKFSGGLSPVTPQKGKSFQDILKEEQKNMATSTAHSRKGKSAPRLATKSPATLTPVKPTSVPLSSPVIQSKNSPASGAFGASPTLGSFIERKAERKHDGVSSIGASWGATPVSKAKNSNLNWGMKQPSPATKSSPVMTQSPQKMRSFSEIQKEEETIRNNEDHMCRIDGNQWFVQQRERAASIGEIQQREQQEQEMLDLIEEQKQIEMAIKKSLQEENAAKKKKQKKKKQNQQRHHRKKPPAKSSAKAEKSTPS
mmetsp:Transcript_3796/g.8113  ORF Transcript_3796/g.8113 Transcript_3796/m.8113 type:complete len:1508 (-) Transcript_3796:28-4551(-)